MTPEPSNEIDTGELKRRAVDWERELKEIRATLVELREERRTESAALQVALMEHIKAFDRFRERSVEKFQMLERQHTELTQMIRGNGGPNLVESVDRLVKLIDGDSRYGIDGLRQTIDRVRTGQEQNKDKIQDINNNWANSIKYGRLIIAAFLLGLGLNIVSVLFFIWTLVQQNAGNLPTVLPGG